MNKNIISLPEKLDAILQRDQNVSMQIFSTIAPFSDILKKNDLVFFPEFTDHGIVHIEKTLQYVENLIAEETFRHMSATEVGVMVLSVVLHDIGMHTNAEMFKSMIDGKYDNLASIFCEGKTWKELWDAFLYDSQYWSDGRKKNVFGDPDYIIRIPDLLDLQGLTEYDKKLIGEFIRINHCRIAQEIAINGYIGKVTIPFGCNGMDSAFIKMAGIVARSHGMDVRDTFDYIEEEYGDKNTPLSIHVVYLMVLLRLADYLQIDDSRTNKTILKISNLYSPLSQQEHKTHLSITNVQFNNNDNEKIVIQASPKDAQTYAKIEKLTVDIQKEFDLSWAILGEVYTDNYYKLRYRRISSNIVNEKYKSKLNYIPKQFAFRYNNDLFKLLIAPLYGNDPSYGVRELVQNAVDACRLCINDLPDDGSPHVKVEVDSKKSLFSITDKGKGMNLYEIENYFLSIGSSFNDNINWKKTRDQDHIYRTGRFGIGVLAAFLLGTEIKVVTRKRNECTGYQFTASMNDSFIQIERVPNIEFGTRIEIKCDEVCMNELRNRPKWYNWYIDNKPKVEYFFDGQSKTPKFNLKEYRELKHNSTKFGAVYWKPTKLENVNWSESISLNNNGSKIRPLYCNGFFICKKPFKKTFLMPELRNSHILTIPSLLVTDIYNQLPLNLKRNNIDADFLYEFEPELANEVFVDLLCQIMALDFNTICGKLDVELFNFHADGFSLRSDYTNKYLKETNAIIIDKSWCPYFLHDRKKKIMFNSSDFYDLFKNTEGSKYLFRFGYIYGYKRYLPPNNATTERILDATKKFLGDNYAKNLKIERIKKDSYISGDIDILDDLFEQYLHNDPIIPYKQEEREKKFPLFFQNHSHEIEKYSRQNL